jgi:hypothetical protein
MGCEAAPNNLIFEDQGTASSCLLPVSVRSPASKAPTAFGQDQKPFPVAR